MRQGATCYMNAMLQQLFLDDALRKTVLTSPLAQAPPEKVRRRAEALLNELDSPACRAPRAYMHTRAAVPSSKT